MSSEFTRRDTATMHLADGLATVTMARPDRRNAFNSQMVTDLTDLFTLLQDRDDCRCVVLTGEGSAFSAGADLEYMREIKNAGHEANVKDAHALAHLLQLIYSHPKPVIGKINGAAIGGGLGLLAACDIAIAKQGCQFAFSEVRLGLAPAVIAPFVIRAIGEKNARRYMLTGDRFNDELAVEIGLIERVVAPGDLDAAVRHLADSVFVAAPGAVASCKELIARSSVGSVEELEGFTAELIANLRAGEEGQEGMAAFLEKRHPSWRSEI